MNRPALSLLCGLVCLLTGPGAASAVEITADAGDCKVSSLPLDPSNALAGTRLSRTSFFGVTREYSTASIELINLSSVSIDRVAVIVEYLDASHKVVLRIPFYATSTDEHLSHLPFPAPSPQFLDKVAGSTEHVVLVGESPLICSVCPTKGRVVSERAWLSNGTEENFSSPVDLDVLPDVLPAYFDSGGCRLSSPVDVLVRLKVKPSGEASSVSVEGETPGQFACLTRELRFWTFTPALRRGIPADSEVELLLRFHSKEALPSDSVAPQLLRNSGSSSLTVVRLLQSEDNLDHWSIDYAGYGCTRTVRSRELYRERLRWPKIGLYRPARIWKSHAE
jgi:hypothetical protein